MGKLIDLTGKKFGRLTVIERVENGKNGHARWNCKCSCGNVKAIKGYHLMSGDTRSCGCYAIERTIIRNATHGKYKTRLYRIWRGMISRCYNKNADNHKNYGGRGIMVCDEWNEFEPFYNWSIDSDYSDDLTLDRINVDGNYEPSNCRWADIKTQANNKTNSNIITYRGKTHTVAEWSNILNINVETLHTRLNRGWDIEKVFNKSDYRSNNITFNGKTQSISKWAIEINMNYSTLQRRLKKGWSVEDALTIPTQEIYSLKK